MKTPIKIELQYVINMARTRLTVVIWEEEGVFVSKCPELEISSTGDTPQEALVNLEEAIDLWLANAKELGILDDFSLTLNSSLKFTSSIEMDI